MNGQMMISWSPGVTLEAIEKQVIMKAFSHYRENKTATANALGIAIRTLDNKLEKYVADEKAEKERQDNARREREQFLTRSRGPGQTADGNQAAKSQGGVGVPAGQRMEPAIDVAEKSALSMPQRKEVQGVLPQQAAQGHTRKAR